MKKFSQRLRYLREEKGLSMKELSLLLGVSDCAISNWENRINEPKASYLLQLSKFFNVSVDYLLGIEDDFGNVVVSGQTSDQLTQKEKRLLQAFGKLPELEQNKLISDAEFYALRHLKQGQH